MHLRRGPRRIPRRFPSNQILLRPLTMLLHLLLLMPLSSTAAVIMKAVLIKAPGGPDQLFIGEAEMPVPGDREVCYTATSPCSQPPIATARGYCFCDAQDDYFLAQLRSNHSHATPLTMPHHRYSSRCRRQPSTEPTHCSERVVRSWLLMWLANNASPTPSEQSRRQY